MQNENDLLSLGGVNSIIRLPKSPFIFASKPFASVLRSRICGYILISPRIRKKKNRLSGWMWEKNEFQIWLSWCDHVEFRCRITAIHAVPSATIADFNTPLNCLKRISCDFLHIFNFNDTFRANSVYLLIKLVRKSQSEVWPSSGGYTYRMRRVHWMCAGGEQGDANGAFNKRQTLP